ncbi:ergosterol biosynthesis protein-like protein [Lojkania enalia]|uniref:Ergosterol biosynthesis protein-like protein n=1 Tax=Lojkania enalia TaxID=147567 RepID=A0A9P4K2R3_9PLEO|nr:ergosterol biosynthesis protein-like protein [Didymosphaeria enalia]
MSSAFAHYLPPFEGLLPKWLLLVAVISIGNSIQAYNTLTYTYRVYNPNHPYLPPHIAAPGSTTNTTISKASEQIPSEVTPLSARKFGTWTFLTSIVRLYAAYNITDKRFYTLGMLTYVVAFGHFMSEWLVFKTTRWGAPLAGPIVISTVSLVWMWTQYDYYIQG